MAMVDSVTDIQGANNPFHYTGCGLDNIYLSSGVNFREADDEYGSGYSINDADDLHNVLCFILALKPAALSAQEVKFLRIEADLSQKELAAKLGVTDQTVSLWERDRQPIQRAESLVLRAFVVEDVLDSAFGMKSLLEHLDTTDFDADAWSRIILDWRPPQAEDDHHWGRAMRA